MTDWTLTPRGEGRYEVVAPQSIETPRIILHVGANISQTELQQIVQGIQFAYENRPNLRANIQLAAQRGLTIGLYVSETPSRDGFDFFAGNLGATDWPLRLFGGSRPVGWTPGDDARIGINFGEVRSLTSYLGAAGASQQGLFERVFSLVFGHEVGHAIFGRHNFSYASLDATIAEVSADIVYRQQVVDDWYAGVPTFDGDNIDPESQILSRATGTSLDDYMREALERYGRAVNQDRGTRLLASNPNPQTIYTTVIDANGAPLLIPLYTIIEQAGGLEVLAWTGAQAGERWIFSGDATRIQALLQSQSAAARQEAAIIISSGIASAQRIEQAGEIGKAFASALGRFLPIEDPLSRWAVSALIGTVVENLGEALEAGGLSKPIGAGLSYDVLRNVLPEFGANLLSGGIGTVSSILVADLIDSMGLEGTLAGDFAQSAGAQYLSTIITNLPGIVNGTTEISDVLQGVSLINVVGSFIGQQLANELVEFDTIGGQIGAALGSAYGSIIDAPIALAVAARTAGFQSISAFAAANPLLAVAIVAIVVLIDTILGGLIGSLFGGTAKAGASLAWNENDQRFAVANVWSKSAGSKDAARSMASQVGELLNGVIAAAGARVIDAGSVQTGAYELKGSRFIYKASAAGSYAFASKDVSKVVTHGAFIALDDLSQRLIGGDVYVKRALAATLLHASGNPDSNTTYSAGDFETNTLVGNIATAQSYGQYLQNASVINALFAAEPNSTFAAGWTITFARVIELGLDRRWKSDWLGGWAAFLDETADGFIDGNAFSPANLFLELDPETSERLFVFTDADGALLGVLGDTIDTGSKDLFLGASGNDVITMSYDIWTESAVTKTGWRISNAAGLSWWNREATGGAAYELIASGPSQQVRVAALIDGGDGDDVIRGGDLGNDVIGGVGNDTLVGGKLDDWLIGGDGADRLFAGTASNISFTLGDSAAENAALALDGGNGDYLEGGLGDDALYGSRGSDWLSGGDGADRLLGGAGGDVLAGGAGDERGALGEARILGGAGSDQYIFGFGDGRDVIFDESDPAGAVGGSDPFAARMAGMLSGALAKNWAGNGTYLENGDVKGGEDAISFGPGVTLRNLVMKRSGTTAAPGADLVIQLAHDVNGTLVLSGDEIIIKDWFTITRRVEWLRFADGEQIRIGDMTSFIVGTSGPDVIIGTFGADFMVGDGGNDQLRGLAGNDYGFGGGGDDFVAGDSDNDLVAGGSGTDEVIGGSGNDTVFGDDGADELYGGAGNDILAGGLGDDAVVTGAGNDIVRFERGDGRDTLIDEHVNNWDIVWQNGAYLNGYTLQSNGTVKLGTEIVFDSQQWLGRYDWDDLNKTLSRHKGAVSGNVASNSGSDSIEFGLGIDIQDITLRRVGNDAVLAVSNGEGDARAFADISDQITIKDWFTIGASIEKFVFTEVGSISGYTLTGGTDAADTMTLTAVANWATGGLGDDVITGSTAGDILSGGLDQDILRGGAGIDILLGGGGNDVLEGGAGGDQLIGGAGTDIASYASSTAGMVVSLTVGAAASGDGLGDVFSGIEGLEGSAYVDRLTGDAGANVLRGLGGADTLTGGAGDDAYEFELGHGADIVRDGVISFEQVLDANGVFNSAQFTATWTRLSLTSSGSYYNHKYRLVVTKTSTGEEVYRSRDNVDFIYVITTSALQPLPSGLSWPAGNGQWKVGFDRTGNGVQATRDFITTGEGGLDTIEFGAGVSLSDLAITRASAGADLVINYSVGDSVTIQGQNNVERRVDAVLLHDRLELSLANLKLVGESATIDGDVMFGDAADNTINGLAGNDVISGAAGADTLIGGAGDDTFEGGAGADSFDGGADSITDNAPLGPTTEQYGDTLRYVRSTAGVIVNLSTRTISGRDAAGAVAAIGDAVGDTIVVSATGGSSIENVTGSDGYGDTLTGDARANRLYGLGGNDTLTGNDGDDVLGGGDGGDTLTGGLGEDTLGGDDGSDTLSGGDGKDFIAGGAGNDTLNGDAGNDTLIGGDGNDSVFGNNDNDNISGEAGDDVLLGHAGDDKIVGGLGADQLFGGDGNDELVGSEGADALNGGAGDDVYFVSAASGADTLVDAQGVNKLVVSGIPSSALWLVHSGADLRITAIGYPSFQVTLSNYFGTTSATLVREVVTEDASLFLSHASSAVLINAMTTASVTTPNAMPTNIAGTLSTYWDAGNVSAPRATAQTLSMIKGGALGGNVGAIDHDENIASYALITASASGVVSLNTATGVWTYTPAATFAGNDSFVIRVTDAAGNGAEQTVSVFVRDPNVNYAPDAPTVVGQPLLNVQEGAVGGLLVATLAASDPNLTTPTLRIASDPSNLFEIVGSELRFRANANLSYATLQNASVQVEALDAADGLVSATRLNVNVGVLESNHAPTLAGQSFNVAESVPGAGQVVVATLAPTDTDLSAVNRNFRYQVLSGDTSVFSVDELTGQIRLQGALDYETRQLYTLQVKVWDGGALGSGLSSTANINFNIANVNEPPSLALVSTTTGANFLVGRVGGVDPEGGGVSYYAVNAVAHYTTAYRHTVDRQVVYDYGGPESQSVPVTGFINAASGNVYYVVLSTLNLTPVRPGQNYIYSGGHYLVDVVSRDQSGLQSQPMTLRIAGGSVLVAPIVLDLDGDGLELISLASSTINFDMAGNGEPERTGWVGADDGLLVYDRNGNGAIDNGGEIAFSEDVDFAVSDLEGLRAHDSNEDGMFGIGDAQYANFAVWRDANQDGVSQAEEMNTLAQLGIDAINLTLNPTGLSVAGATDNVIYGTTNYLRADGSIGMVGDVYLAYVDWTMSVEASAGGGGEGGQLPPIVLDLDGDGVHLTASADSNVRFDANGDGFNQRTGWFSAGDGVLAVDRNGDGLINSGLEISFREDALGAQSDLEGLAAYDSNENGMLDAGDARYGDLLVWRDANQDGFSQSHELASLARQGVAAINLTRSNAAPPSADVSANSILAEGVFLWRDGGVGQLADVTLGYQSDGAAAPGAADGGGRTADDQGTEHPTAGGGGGGGASGGGRDDDRGAAEPIDLSDRRRRGRSGEGLRPRRERGEDRRQPAFANAANDSEESRAPAAALGAPRSALHSGLGVMDRKLLGMIDATAQFEASSSADLGLGRKKLDPRVAELLTALPDIR